MTELNKSAEQAQEFFDTNNLMPIPGKWVKWYHEGIPDGPEDLREKVRKAYSVNRHCLDCT